MQNIVINMCEKFHYDRLRNDRALGNGKYDNKNNNNKSLGTRFAVQKVGAPFQTAIKLPRRAVGVSKQRKREKYSSANVT